MIRHSSTRLALAALALVAPLGARAQSRPAPPTATIFTATPYVGYLTSSDSYSGPVGTGIGQSPAYLLGAQLGMRIAPNLTLLGNIATGSSDITGQDQYLGNLGGVTLGQSTVVLYDADLQLDIPLGSAMTPFVQAGVGGMRYDITQSYFTTSSTNLAGNLGAGVDFDFGHGVGLQLLAKDYIGRFDTQQAYGYGTITNTTQNYALSLGARFAF